MGEKLLRIANLYQKCEDLYNAKQLSGILLNMVMTGMEKNEEWNKLMSSINIHHDIDYSAQEVHD